MSKVFGKNYQELVNYYMDEFQMTEDDAMRCADADFGLTDED